jgi:hypothetical protein
MRYTDADLSELIPFKFGGFLTKPNANGLYTNEPRNAINHWLLFALTRIYNSMARGISTCESPFSLAALKACSESQLAQLFGELSPIPFWSDIDHDVKAQFLYNLYCNYSKVATPRGLTDIIAYCLNDYDINVEAVNEAAHLFSIRVDVNLETLGEYEKFLARFVAYISEFVPTTEHVSNVVVNESDNDITATCRMISGAQVEATEIIISTGYTYITR